jgi:hypothetical protein
MNPSADRTVRRPLRRSTLLLAAAAAAAVLVLVVAGRGSAGPSRTVFSLSGTILPHRLDMWME